MSSEATRVARMVEVASVSRRSATKYGVNETVSRPTASGLPPVRTNRLRSPLATVSTKRVVSQEMTGPCVSYGLCLTASTSPSSSRITALRTPRIAMMLSMTSSASMRSSVHAAAVAPPSARVRMSCCSSRVARCSSARL